MKIRACWFIRSKKDVRWNAEGEETLYDISTWPSSLADTLALYGRVFGKRPADVLFGWETKEIDHEYDTERNLDLPARVYSR